METILFLRTEWSPMGNSPWRPSESAGPGSDYGGWAWIDTIPRTIKKHRLGSMYLMKSFLIFDFKMFLKEHPPCANWLGFEIWIQICTPSSALDREQIKLQAKLYYCHENSSFSNPRQWNPVGHQSSFCVCFSRLLLFLLKFYPYTLQIKILSYKTHTHIMHYSKTKIMNQ